MIDAPTVAIATVVDAIGANTVIGAKRAGLLCLPDGKARWRDLEPPSETMARSAIVNALRRDGFGVVEEDVALYGPVANPSPRALRITLMAADLQLCQVGFGISGNRLKGTLTVRWEEFDRTARQRRSSDEYVVPISAAKLTRDGVPGTVLDALTRSVARWTVSRGRKAD